MWCLEVLVALAWAWALLDYTTVVHVHNSTYERGVLYDTHGGSRGRTTCHDPCAADCTGAQWAGFGALAAISATAFATKRGQHRGAALLRTLAFIGMVAVVALVTQLNSDSCRPSATKITVARARYPLVSAGVVAGVLALSQPVLRSFGKGV